MRRRHIRQMLAVGASAGFGVAIVGLITDTIVLTIAGMVILGLAAVVSVAAFSGARR